MDSKLILDKLVLSHLDILQNTSIVDPLESMNRKVVVVVTVTLQAT